MDLREQLSNAGHDDIKYFLDYDWDDAIIGVTINDNIVYDYNKIAELLIKTEGFNYVEAIEWINNFSRSLVYMGNKAPIIMYSIN